MSGRVGMRRERIKELVGELNRLYPELKTHTDLDAWKYLPRMVTCGSVLISSFLTLVIWFLIMACLIDELKVGASVMAWVVGVILVLAFVWAIWRLDCDTKQDLVEVSWGDSTIEYLQEKLEAANSALDAYQSEKQAVMSLINRVDKLNEIATENGMGEIKTNCEKQPFKIYGKIYGDEFERELSDDGCDWVVKWLACVYYGSGGQYIHTFKETFEIEGKAGR